MKGWECPKCGSIYSPFVQECRSCSVDGRREKEVEQEKLKQQREKR